ncbi:MAG: chromosome segregation protein [Deferribacteraceae bacterium]|jgi:chromosome segregation protein|nr:chromosome segregation protein [Deferribacteraceae bacterium]
MKFKSLYLQGFKSFVDKTVIDFPDGVTCIVGPNGSGKSNILDAIRWVFGEQSPKELRGNNMEDVIFAGSESRKPSGFAEVSLVIKDVPEDVSVKWGTLSEVMITRKYYKSGEREYLINSRKCKLKDIKEIFYDTGIGARSISIIEQGRVEKIIQATPEELRLFFEETAGVTKYKESKKEAERRLAQTKDNLNRIIDIINEVKTSMGTLSDQVERLEHYKRLKDEKELKEKVYFSNVYKIEKDKIKDLNERINNFTIELSTEIGKFEKLRKEEYEIKSEINKLDVEKNTLNDLIIKDNANISSLESDIKILRNNLDGAENTKKHIKNEIESSNNKLKELSDNKETLTAEISGFESEFEELNNQLQDLNNELEELVYQKENYEEELVELESRFLEYTESITNKRNEIYKCETEIERIEKDLTNLEKEYFELESKKSVAKEGYEKSLKEKGSIVDELSILEENLKNFNESLSNYKQMREKLVKELNSVNMELSSLKSKRDTLVSQLSTELYGNQKGSVSIDLFKPRLFLEIANQLDESFGKIYGDLIVFDADKKADVLENIKNIPISMKFIFSDEVEDFIKNLTLARYEQHSDNIIKVGNIYHKIGSDNKSKIIIELKSQIADIEKRLKILESSKDEIQKQIHNIDKNLEDFSDKISKLSSLKQEYDRKMITFENAVINFEKEIKNIQERSSIILSEKEFNKKELNVRKTNLKKLKDELDIIGDGQKNIDAEKEDIEEKIEFYQSKIDDLKDEISSIKANSMVINERLKSHKKSLHLIEREISNTSSNISNLKSRLEKLLTVNITNWNASIEEKTLLLKEANIKKLKNEEKKQFIVNKMEELRQELDKILEKVEKANSHIKSIESNKSMLEITIAECRQHIMSVREQFLDKFNIEIDTLYGDFIEEDFKQNKLKNEIKHLESEIENLGPLNMAAESEYNEIKERYEFLVGQKEDLENAYSSINDIINEIDKNTIKNFTDTFYMVNENFVKVFKILFGEGKAELKLTDPENMLNTGVEIFVQPPGKKLQNMNLLSGGEKAMIACTLIFAMFLCKPTPFCFLDEIDAPLDDANVERFCKIVRTLSENTQFVIITHNQKTMASADSLYGITMQEPGVSKVISVRLS